MDLVSLFNTFASLPGLFSLRGVAEEAEMLRIVLFMVTMIGCGSLLATLVGRDARG